MSNFIFWGDTDSEIYSNSVPECIQFYLLSYSRKILYIKIVLRSSLTKFSKKHDHYCIKKASSRRGITNSIAEKPSKVVSSKRRQGASERVGYSWG